MRKTFTQLISTMLLGMLVLLTPYGLRAQEAQTTLETFAGETEVTNACYNGDNLYELKILVRDFVKIEELDLQLDYDAAVFDFVSHDVEVTELSGLTVTESTDGTLRFQWSTATSTDIQPNNDTTHIVTLWFNVDNFPFNTAYDYTSAFVWDVDNSFYSYDSDDNQDIFTTKYADGSLSVSVKEEFQNITVTPDEAVCYNSNVNVTVEPDGYMYSFNGESYTDNNVGNASEGENWVRLKDEDGCVSLRETFTITAPEPVVYDVLTEDATCYGGNGEIQFINVDGGTPEYNYIAIPAEDYNDVRYDWYYSDKTMIEDYMFSTEQLLRPAGDYYVAVQDANGCVRLFDVNFGVTPAWTYVSIGEPDEFTFTATPDGATCYGGEQGSVNISGITGGTPWTDLDGQTGYKVWIDGVVVDTLDAGSFLYDELAAGDYMVTIQDSLGCMVSETVTVGEPNPIWFSVGYEDVPCVEDPDGQIWIEAVYEVTASGDVELWSSSAGNAPDWSFVVQSSDTTTVDVTVGDTVTMLEPNYYSVYLKHSTICDSVAYSNPDGSGNTVPVMSPDLITFQTVETDAVCVGSETGTITITSLSGAANYEFSLDGADWQDTTTTYVDLAAGTYAVSVRDADNMEACEISKDVVIDEPDAALTLDVTNTVAPTCDGGNDGNAFASAGGGWPFHDANGDIYYEYSLDGSPYWVTNPVFAVTEGEHTLTVRDSLGCEVDVDFSIDELEPTVLEASVPENPIYCYDSTTVVLFAFDTKTNNFPDTQYEFYVSSSSDMSGMEIFMPGTATDADELGAGTYYFQAKDPNGCWSNVEELVIKEGEELEIVEWSKTDASCAEYWDGTITVKVTGGSPFSDVSYKYALKNNKEVFSNPNATINWQPFSNDDPDNDSTTTIQTLKGTYFLGVADSCGSIVITDTIVIEGYDPIEIDDNLIESQAVTCYGDEDGYIDMTGAVTGGNGEYLYTLYDADGIVDGTEDQTSPMFDELFAGDYGVKVTDTSDPACPADSVAVFVPTPDMLVVDYDTVHVSCYGEEDGEISINIMGGTGGNYGLGGYDATTYDEDGKKYRVVINNTDSEGTSYGSYTYADDVDSKTFQVAAGEYVIKIYDANGCELGPDTITIEQPDMWDVTVEATEPGDCDADDGEFEVTVNGGGWTGLALQFQLNEDGWVTQTDSVYTFTDIEYGTDTIYVRVDPAAVAAAEDSINPASCYYQEIITISEPMPFEYDDEVVDVTCYGADNGKLIITNVTGGSGLYQFQIVNAENPNYNETDDDRWFPNDESGAELYVTEYTFDSLAYGHHTLYIRDDAGYTLSNCQVPESWEIHQPDSLEITETMWIQDVSCNGGADGSFEIMVEGGTPGYKYAYTETQVVGVPTAEHPYINMPDPTVASLWQDSPVFTGVEAGTYIAWVVDANGCFQGGEIRETGAVVDQHRVVIDEPVEITAEINVTADATCYGEADGQIWLENVMGGNGADWSFQIVGTDYDGNVVDSVYTDVTLDNGYYKLTGLVASDDGDDDEEEMTDYYAVYVMDDLECPQFIDSVWVGQPEEFVIDLVIDEDAFICANDLAGIVDIITVSGGTTPVEYQIYRDGDLVRDWTSNASHVVEAGYTYKVIAEDANGCQTEVEEFIESPVPVTFDVIDLTCYGDELASARIEVEGETDRMFRVIYVETENDIAVASDTTEWFESEINMNNEFVFDGESIDDVHYEIVVEDNFGCKSEIGVFTFDPVQTQLTLTTEVDGDMITASAIGGTVDSSSDYQYAIETVDYTGSLDAMMWSNENMLTVDSFATWVVYVRDLNWCWTTDTIESIGFTTMTVAEVQGNGDVSPAEDEVVGVTGTVTAVVENDGFFMQDANGAGNGIWVAYETTSSISIGDGVMVVGTVAEVESVTTILADEVTEAAAPVVVVADTLTSPSAAIDEMYESVLVIVEGAWGAEANEDGQWEIYYKTSDSVVVNDWIYAYTPTAGNVYHVTGVVNGKADAYMLEPRMESDIVDVTATTPVDPEIELVEFKVYPNPFNDHIKIDNNDKLTRVVVSNIAGQRVMDLEYPSHEIRTARLVSGVYVVSMFTEDGLAKTERIIKR